MKIGGKIRRLRKLRGLTIEELADRTELTKGFISQLERDMTDPSFSNLKRVIEALGIEFTRFFDDLEEREKNIYKRKDRVAEKKGRGYQFFGLIPKLKYLEMEPVLLVIAPEASYTCRFAEDEGFGYVTRGHVQLSIEAESSKLSRGDCFYLFFDNSLEIINLTDKPAEILLVHY